MTDLTPEVVEELRRLEAKATPGLWQVSGARHKWRDGSGDQLLDSHTFGPDSDAIGLTFYSAKWHTEQFANPRLIVALHNAAPALIRAAEENAQLRAGNEMLSAANEAFSRDAIQLRARLAKAEVTLREIVSLTSAPAMRDADQDNIAVRVTVSMVRGYAKAALADYSVKETE